VTRPAAAIALIGAALLMSGQPAHGHARGTHKRLLLTISDQRVEVLVTLDVDEGERATLLRRGADRDGSGRLEGPEVAALRERLTRLALRPVEIRVGGYPVRLAATEAKLSLRGEEGAQHGGLNVAVLARAELPQPPREGMVLEVADASPDGSRVRVEAQQQWAQGGTAPVQAADLRPKERMRFRLVAPR
jgi:hypothetical protein